MIRFTSQFICAFCVFTSLFCVFNASYDGGGIGNIQKARGGIHPSRRFLVARVPAAVESYVWFL